MPNATGASTFSHHRRIRCKNDVGGLKAIWYNGNIILPAISWYIFYPWRVSYISCFDVFCYTEYKSSWKLHSTIRFSTRDLLSAIRDLPSYHKPPKSRSGGIRFMPWWVIFHRSGPIERHWWSVIINKLVWVISACRCGFWWQNLETHLPCPSMASRNRAWRKVPLQLGHCAR